MSDEVEVRLVDYPLALYRRAAEHHDELLREFTLITLRTPDDPAHTVPARLRALMEALTARYGGIVSGVAAVRDAALARGDESVLLVYRVPRSVREPSLELGRMLDEADEYCRAGRRLLTLAAPPDVRAFRCWYLGEFVRQIDGEPARPWTADLVAAQEIRPEPS